MGGKALHKIDLQPDRIDTATLVNVFNDVHRRWLLHTDLPLRMVPWTADKNDHGDIDVISPLSVGETELIVSQFVLIHNSITNDNVISWGVPFGNLLVQMDFICVYLPENKAPSLFYAGTDLGMLLGRVAAWLGFKLMPDGLYVRKTPATGADIFVTTDPCRILSILGYSTFPSFETRADVWNYILRGRYTAPWAFLPSSTTAENRSRDAARPSMASFQAWVAQNWPCTPCGKYEKRGDLDAALRHLTDLGEHDLAGTVAGRVRDALANVRVDQWHKTFAKSVGHQLYSKAFPCTVFSAEQRAQLADAVAEFLPPGSDARMALVNDSGHLDPTYEMFLITTLQRRFPQLANHV